MKAHSLIGAAVSGEHPRKLVDAIVRDVAHAGVSDEINSLAGQLEQSLPSDVTIVVSNRFGSSPADSSITLRYPSFEVAKKEASNGIWHNHPKAVLITIYTKGTGKAQIKALIQNSEHKVRNQTVDVGRAARALADYFKEHVK